MSKYKNKRELVRELCCIESNPILFNFKLNSKEISLWPLIRYMFIQNALDQEFKLSNPWIKRPMSFFNWFRYFVLTLKYSTKRMPRSNIIMFGSDIANIYLGKSYFNRLNEFFASVFPKETSLLESANNYSYKRPRTYSKVFSRDEITLFSLLKDKLIRRNNKKLISYKNIDDFISFLKKESGYEFNDTFYDRLRGILISYEYRAPIIFEKYLNFFKKKKPKIIFLEQGCYGADSTLVILAAKKLNIHIAEIQHGYIGLDHPAYVFSSDICQEYIQYLPNELITYGKYWSDNIRLPIPTVVIGNPYLSEEREVRLNTKKQTNYILYISSAINPAAIVKEVLELKKVLEAHNFKIVFRPHPAEYQNIENVYNSLIQNDIKIDNSNIYDSLSKFKFVISNALSPSTTMYEAIAFGCQPIFIFDGSFMLEKEYFFEYINDSSEIMSILLKNTLSEFQNDVWADNWQEDYKAYVSEFIGVTE